MEELMVNVGQITLSFVRGSDVDLASRGRIRFDRDFVCTDLVGRERSICVSVVVDFLVGKRKENQIWRFVTLR